MTSLAPMHCNGCFKKVLLQALWREVLGLEMWWKYCEDIDGTLWKGKGYQHFYIVERVRYKDVKLSNFNNGHWSNQLESLFES